ncbi:hypothetical protein [Azospirillum canadense]|uniref:hypothetical protein n=1 Tax=Azospirillum canadense TaxID=403962 RepID=UPI00222753D1|nr:hypothetical protein [Azospirillum canadense]MCW2239299.1 hypothetical protein [Azospirillum canadense]
MNQHRQTGSDLWWSGEHRAALHRFVMETMDARAAGMDDRSNPVGHAGEGADGDAVAGVDRRDRWASVSKAQLM